MGVRVVAVSFHEMQIKARMSFRYGIAALTACPHLFVRVEAEVNGKRAVGVSADNLPPKWFTKDPSTSYEDDLRDMRQVIEAAGRHAVEVGEQADVYSWWRAVYEAQKGWAASTKHPPLLWNFGVSLIERAVIDAFCRGEGVRFHEALRTGRLGVAVAYWLPRRPSDSIQVRHTVGFSDPLDAGDATPRLDGLPQTLEEAIKAYQLTYFKIKLSGDIAADVGRLVRIAALLERVVPTYAYTLDGNENFRELTAFRALWSELAGRPELRSFLARLIFVEQPLHRNVALDVSLRGWAGRPPMIVDESDAELGSLDRALAAGYVGTSHKNCKGVFKGLANAARIARLGQGFILSGEDLTNIGPVALLQDLAVLAALGVTQAERNGHHYVRGLSQLPMELQRAMVGWHGDLYRWHDGGFATVQMWKGALCTASVAASPFGYGIDFDPRLIGR